MRGSYFLGWLCAGLMAVGGCTTALPPPPETQPVWGTVTYNGKPCQGAAVMLTRLPLGTARWTDPKPTGIVSETGAFELWSYAPEDGAIEGEYVVTIVWDSDGINPGGLDVFKGRFADPTKPVTAVTIKAGDNQLDPIALTGPAVVGPGTRQLN